MPRWPARILLIVALAILAEVLLIASAIIYMVVYSYLINPGHAQQFYEQHVNAAAPWVSIFCGIPIFFIISWWLARRAARFPIPAANIPLSIAASAIGFWLAWALIDNSLMLAAGGTEAIRKVLPLWAASQITKPLAIWAAAHLRHAKTSR